MHFKRLNVKFFQLLTRENKNTQRYVTPLFIQFEVLGVFAFFGEGLRTISFFISMHIFYLNWEVSTSREVFSFHFAWEEAVNFIRHLYKIYVRKSFMVVTCAVAVIHYALDKLPSVTTFIQKNMNLKDLLRQSTIKHGFYLKVIFELSRFFKMPC